MVARFAGKISGRVMLTTGLLITGIGNVLFWAIAHANLGYLFFVIGMLVAGSGAGILAARV